MINENNALKLPEPLIGPLFLKEFIHHLKQGGNNVKGKEFLLLSYEVGK